MQSRTRRRVLPHLPALIGWRHRSTLNPYKGDTVPQTRTHPHLAKDMSSRLRRLMCADNCEKLADLMEAMPKRRHEQSTFGLCVVDKGKEANVCGTTACALGWAVLTHLIPGLQYKMHQFSTYQLRNGVAVDVVEYSYVPLLNGVETSWGLAGEYCFGEAAWHRVFSRGRGSRATVIRRLRAIAVAYRNGENAGGVA